MSRLKQRVEKKKDTLGKLSTRSGKDTSANSFKGASFHCTIVKEPPHKDGKKDEEQNE